MSELDIPTADPESVRAEADRIVALPELRDDRNLIERAVDWIADQIGGLVPDRVGDGGSALLTALVVVAAVAVLVLATSKLLRRLGAGPRRQAPGGGLTVVLGEVVDPSELGAAIMAAESAGDWRAALVARYRLMVATLVGRGVLSDLPGRTTGEHRAEFAGVRPDRSEDFAAATSAFEHAFYGVRSVDADDVAALRARATAVTEGQSSR